MRTRVEHNLNVVFWFLKMSVDSFVEGFVTSLFLGQQGENN
jgi:hypothetical protein